MFLRTTENVPLQAHQTHTLTSSSPPKMTHLGSVQSICYATEWHAKTLTKDGCSKAVNEKMSGGRVSSVLLKFFFPDIINSTSIGDFLLLREQNHSKDVDALTSRTDNGNQPNHKG